MKTGILGSLMIAGLLLAPVPATAQLDVMVMDEASPVRRILVIGEDDEAGSPAHFYRVDCKNRRKGSVVVYEEPRRVCATPQYDPEQCRSAWTLERAAAYTCQP